MLPMERMGVNGKPLKKPERREYAKKYCTEF